MEPNKQKEKRTKIRQPFHTISHLTNLGQVLCEASFFSLKTR